MATELEMKIIQSFAQHMAADLNEAAIIGRTASGLGDQGLAERAFQILFDIEPFVRNTPVLLNACSIVRRRGREIDVD